MNEEGDLIMNEDVALKTREEKGFISRLGDVATHLDAAIEFTDVMVGSHPEPVSENPAINTPGLASDVDERLRSIEGQTGILLRQLGHIKALF